MFTIEGRHNSATIFAESLENSAIGQLRALCNQEFTSGMNIRIMPDAHAGSGCVVGTTMTVKDKIVPNIVGVDIGCGMEVVNIGDVHPDFRKLDKVIRERVPSGFAIRTKPHRFFEETRLDELTCAKILEPDKTARALGTLGGGNHFIEIDKDPQSGDHFLIIHSGSRNPGLQVANCHQDIAGKN